MPERRSLRARTSLTSGPSAPAAAPVSTRPRRAAAAASGSVVKVTRDESNSPEDSKKALRLTVKIPSSKLLEATSNTRPTLRGDAAAQLRDSLTTGEIVSGPRTSRANKKYVVESESDEEDDEEDEDVDASVDDVEDEDDEEEQEEEEQIGGPEEISDEEADEEDEDADADADADAEADVDADGDVEMDDDADDGQPLPSQQPVLKVKGPAAKPTVTVTPAQDAKIKSVEAKEMEMDDDDEELSDLSQDDEEEGEGGEEDAEGEDVDEMDQDDGSRSPGSRASTPDVSKMTKRQRSRLDQVMGSDFLQLPMGMHFPPYLLQTCERLTTSTRTSNKKASHS